MAPFSTIIEDFAPQKKSEKSKFKIKIIWFNVIYMIYLHASFLYAIYLCFTTASWKTALFSWFYAQVSGLGVTAGAHRLWSHRSYKAKWPLRVVLCCFFSIAGMNDIYNWCRDHRVHHKYTETDADPHNIKRGFFFAHMGWLMCKKHSDVIKKGRSISLDDLLADPVVKFHRKFYLPISFLFGFVLPTAFPVWFWSETIWNSFFIAGLARNCYVQNCVWLVNSVAHKFGDRPYDKDIEPRENIIVSILGHGEGWHNYHHAFPWDYSTSELGYTFNFTKVFIDLMALIGQAYDMKSARSDMINNTKLKKGDGSRIKEINK